MRYSSPIKHLAQTCIGIGLCLFIEYWLSYHPCKHPHQWYIYRSSHSSCIPTIILRKWGEDKGDTYLRGVLVWYYGLGGVGAYLGEGTYLRKYSLHFRWSHTPDNIKMLVMISIWGFCTGFLFALPSRSGHNWLPVYSMLLMFSL